MSSSPPKGDMNTLVVGYSHMSQTWSRDVTREYFDGRDGYSHANSSFLNKRRAHPARASLVDYPPSLPRLDSTMF